jgi:hydroxymethylpyrimidine/phosphomethylpyrimidine kinase
VVVTGGHRDEATDLFFDGETLTRIPGDRHADGAAHGSGCTHSSALAAHLALGLSPLDAARAARRIAGGAVRDGLRGLGAGAGPVDVFGLTRRPGTGASTGRTATGPLA